MTVPMKRSALQKKLAAIEVEESHDFSPDITNQVEAACTHFNSYVLKIRETLLNLRSDTFDASLLNTAGEKYLLDFFDRMENNIEKMRADFEEFLFEYKKMTEAGCKVAPFAKTCVSNAKSATRDLVFHFEADRQLIMDKFYDAVPTNVRLGQSPVFGTSDSLNIQVYLDGLSV